MNNNATLEKMKELRFTGMKNAFENVLNNANHHEMTNDEFICYLLEAEWLERINRKTERLIRSARFRYQACIENIEYSEGRNLDKNLMLRLADCGFIERGENIIITGPTGTGKSYLSSALGYQACLKGYKVMYFNLGKLFSKLRMAKADGTYIKEISRIEKQDLIIIDDFGLQPIDAKNTFVLLDIFEDRHQNKSTIITSQVPLKKWYDLIPEKTIADAILDRIVHTAHRIELKGESLRRTMAQKKKQKIRI